MSYAMLFLICVLCIFSFFAGIMFSDMVTAWHEAQEVKSDAEIMKQANANLEKHLRNFKRKQCKPPVKHSILLGLLELEEINNN